VDLYSAFIVVPHTQCAQVRITQCYLRITPYLSLPRKHSPDGVFPHWGCGQLIAAYYSFYLPRKDERLSRPGWLTYSGRFTHISGHPSAAGRAQDSESSPVRDRRRLVGTTVFVVIWKVRKSYFCISQRHLSFPNASVRDTRAMQSRETATDIRTKY